LPSPPDRPGPRIAPLEPPYDADTAAMLQKWMPPDSPFAPLALFRTLARHEELFARMRVVGAGILGHGRIDARERELVIARTCARSGAEYEWGVHAVVFGAPVGLTEAEIAATASGDAAWTGRDALLIRLADELHDTSAVSDDVWSGLRAHYGPDELLELVIVCGWYRLISYIVTACRVPLEPWAARFPS
jgi:4-carboxymuconolactone decarboxylase